MSEPSPNQLADGEVELTEDEELWRQVHPTWIDNGGVFSAAFIPAAKDAGMLSLTRSTKVTAQESYVEYVEEFGLVSIGVLCVTVFDARDQDMKAVDDSNAETKPDPCPTGHCYIDFRDKGNKQRRRTGAILRDRAVERGWAHRVI